MKTNEGKWIQKKGQRGKDQGPGHWCTDQGHGCKGRGHAACEDQANRGKDKGALRQRPGACSKDKGQGCKDNRYTLA